MHNQLGGSTVYDRTLPWFGKGSTGLIESLPIDLVDASRNLVLDTAHIKANHVHSYANAFVVALTQREGAVVLTGDPEFQAAEGIINIEWLPR